MLRPSILFTKCITHCSLDSILLWSLIISPLHRWRKSKLNILQHLQTVQNYRNKIVFFKAGRFNRKTILAQFKVPIQKPKNLLRRFESRRQERNQWPSRQSDPAAMFTDYSVFQPQSFLVTNHSSITFGVLWCVCPQDNCRNYTTVPCPICYLTFSLFINMSASCPALLSLTELRFT